MDGVSAAASVIQLVDTVVSLFQYFKAVKNAKIDIDRLQGELGSLKTVLEGARQLLEGPKGIKLHTSHGLRDGLRVCSSQLTELKTKLEKKLDPGKTGKKKALFRLSDLMWPFESKDVDGIIQALRLDRDTVSAGLNIDQTALLLERFERIDDEERLTILEWISPIQYRKHHETIKEDRTLNTCEWLLRCKEFHGWKNNSSSVILWLQGSPGVGKTFVTSKVIDHVQNLSAPPSHEGFAFFYCNRNEEERRQPLAVLRSYVRQLSTTTGNPGDMQSKLRDLYRKTRLQGSDLTFDTCKEQLLESVNLYPQTTLVLDALDECEPDSRHRLVDAIEFLLSEATRPLKIFISSRPDADIRDRFLSRPHIRIEATDNQDDIEKFVNEEIVKHRRWGKMSLSLQGDIVKTLLDRSDGMFQWANLQIKQLLDLRTEAAIRDRLGKLPVGLEAAYNEIYNKIAARNEHEKVLADRAFMWVMCAYRPLNSAALLSAIRLDPDSDILHLSEEVDEDILLDICNNLLVLDSQRAVWRFSHLSVTEYFEHNHWCLRQAHCYGAKVCLVLLNETRENLSGDNVEPRGLSDLKHPLQIYARHCWMLHAETQEGQEADSMLNHLLKSFLGSFNESSLQYRMWHHQISRDYSLGPWRSWYNLAEEISPESATILAICRFSFYTLLLDWWDTAELALPQTNIRGEDLLTLAARAGCEPICEALIKRWTQVSTTDQSLDYGTALAAAAAEGEAEIVEFLAEKGADVNMAAQGKYGSALAAATTNRDTEIMEFLVRKGADVNMVLQSGGYGSALVAAVAGGSPEVVEFLVEKGADVNMVLQSGGYGSALVTAVVEGSPEVVELLVEKGADVNMVLQSGGYGSALIAAAVGGSPEVVEFLVEKGADVNMVLQSGRYGSALVAAAAKGRTKIVELLVEKGADVNMVLQNGRYGSALVAAATNRSPEAVELLVEMGADVNMVLQNGRYSSALVAAAAKGRTKIVELLIEKGADVNMVLQNGRYSSAIEAAIANRHT